MCVLNGNGNVLTPAFCCFFFNCDVTAETVTVSQKSSTGNRRMGNPGWRSPCQHIHIKHDHFTADDNISHFQSVYNHDQSQTAPPTASQNSLMLHGQEECASSLSWSQYSILQALFLKALVFGVSYCMMWRMPASDANASAVKVIAVIL